MTTQNIVVTFRCRTFSSEGVRANRLYVGPDDTVRVYDPVAGHYTLCHDLGPHAVRRAQTAAAMLRNGYCDESATCYFDH